MCGFIFRSQCVRYIWYCSCTRYSGNRVDDMRYSLSRTCYQMTKSKRSAERAVWRDIVILHASLALTEPRINDTQMRMLLRLARTARARLAAARGRK